MDREYSFWADLLATFRASPDLVKALWLLIPPGFLLGVLALLLRYRAQVKRQWRDTPTRAPHHYELLPPASKDGPTEQMIDLFIAEMEAVERLNS